MRQTLLLFPPVVFLFVSLVSGFHEADFTAVVTCHSGLFVWLVPISLINTDMIRDREVASGVCISSLVGLRETILFLIRSMFDIICWFNFRSFHWLNSGSCTKGCKQYASASVCVCVCVCVCV